MTHPSSVADQVIQIHWVQLDAGVDDHDHFIDPAERLRIAMDRQ